MKKHAVLLLAVLMTVTAVPGIIFLQRQMDGMIREHKLLNEQFAEDGGAPPGITFSTVFLGGFRNLIADALWLRMTRLQDEGNYYELVQLADWILKVQPSNSQVAQFLAWNMAYNISVIQQDFSDRWRWVRKGVETIIEGIRLNPNEPMLYRELSWMFYFKMGDQMDVANQYYKFRFASEMYQLLGGKHSPDWAELNAAPGTKKQFMERFPDRQGQKSVLWAQPNGFSDFDALMKYFSENGMLPEKLKEALGEKGAKDCELGLRRILLRKVWYIEPQYAMDIEKEYGKLDWLNTNSHAIYWAVRGIRNSPERQNTACRQVLTNALRVSFASGRIVFPAGKPSRQYLLLPNLGLMEAANNVYMDESGGKPVPGDSAHANFLMQAIDTFYFYGQKKEAMKYFLLLRDELKYGDAVGLTLEQFVQNRLRIMIKMGTWYQIIRLVQSFIIQSAYALGNGEHEEAEQMLETASQLYQLYLKRNNTEEEAIRLKLPPFAEFKRMMTEELMRSIPDLAPALKAELELQKSYGPVKK